MSEMMYVTAHWTRGSLTTDILDKNSDSNQNLKRQSVWASSLVTVEKLVKTFWQGKCAAIQKSTLTFPGFCKAFPPRSSYELIPKAKKKREKKKNQTWKRCQDDYHITKFFMEKWDYLVFISSLCSCKILFKHHLKFLTMRMQIISKWNGKKNQVRVFKCNNSGWSPLDTPTETCYPASHPPVWSQSFSRRCIEYAARLDTSTNRILEKNVSHHIFTSTYQIVKQK